jgi:hypothetical protein
MFFHQKKLGKIIIIIIVIWGVSSVKLTNFASFLGKNSKLFITQIWGEKNSALLILKHKGEHCHKPKHM